MISLLYSTRHITFSLADIKGCLSHLPLYQTLSYVHPALLYNRLYLLLVLSPVLLIELSC